MIDSGAIGGSLSISQAVEYCFSHLAPANIKLAYEKHFQQTNTPNFIMT
jgi:hypothetical protein